MNNRFLLLCVSVILLTCNAIPALAVRPQLELKWNSNEKFILATQNSRVGLVVDQEGSEPVHKAVALLAADFEKVFGQSSVVRNQLGTGNQIVIGELSKSSIIKHFVSQYKLKVDKLTDCFECYQFNFIKTESGKILLIIGADRRGAAYGAIELSRALGVSPWEWWADVIPQKQMQASMAMRDSFFPSPSVKYRGIFINDEDFGLFPWAAFNFEKSGNIGTKTYDKIFELMLRLRANTLWPAMHEVSAPFNSDPANAKLAHEYGIVMGSSHAEPLLRNNVGEWKYPAAEYNFATHAKQVGDYWQERINTNKSYENLYTIGMRGIHDSAMQGAKTPDERKELLDQVLAYQWELLTSQVGSSAPHIFVPYKEVLDVYSKGLKLPPETIIVLPDDNFGYIRRFPNAVDRSYTQKFGVYYHLSYLGAPLSYLWLATTPPELLRTELSRAYESGIKEFWMFNVGDIKPAEPLLDYAMELAWDYSAVSKYDQKSALQKFSTKQFGAGKAADIAEVMNSFYLLNFERRPEHLQYYLPKEAPKTSGLSEWELLRRKEKAEALIKQVGALDTSNNYDAVFELVEYPALASAYAHLRFVYLELYAKYFPHNQMLGQQYGNQAVIADEKIKALTKRYNQQIANGKWNYMMAEEPANNILASYRLNKPLLPIYVDGIPELNNIKSNNLTSDTGKLQVDLSLLSRKKWEWLDGIESLKSISQNAQLVIPYAFNASKDYCVSVDMLPLFNAQSEVEWELEVNVGDIKHLLKFGVTYNDAAWSKGVLNNRITQRQQIRLNNTADKIILIARHKNFVIRGINISRARCD